MKSLVLSLSLLLASITASAQTSNIRLQMSRVPTSPTASLVSVYVLADGSVERSSFIRASKMMPVVKKVGQLSVEEVDRIDNLIEEARGGEVVVVPQRAFCFVAPFFFPTETADNGKVFLASGGICQQQKVNTSVEAKELVGIINDLFQKYGNK